MDKEKRKKIIIITVVILVIIGILWIIFRLSDQKIPEDIIPIEEQPVFQIPSADLEFVPNTNPTQSNTEFSAVNLAKSYAERFGSWSSDSRGHNLVELMPLSTNSMQSYLSSIATVSSDEFSGVSTKSISVQVLSLDEDFSAEIMVNTQRIETKADLSTNVFYQDIQVSLIKSGETWLVNEADWQE